jgi:hypothetical protein
MSTTQQSDRELGPRRFQRQQFEQPKGSASRAFGAFFVLLLLVVGVPAAAMYLDAVPSLPTSLPTRDDVTGAIGAEQLVSVLVWVAALAWLQFLICVLVELRSAVRGVGLPSRVPMSGPSQRFARALVASVLVAVSAAGTATAAAPGPSVPVTPEVSVSVVAEQAEHQAQQRAVGTEVSVSHEASNLSDDATFYLGDEEIADEDARDLVGKKVYRVQPPDGRYHDNLWDIAERHLGDGRRYQEIYELNKGRDQPDGHELSLARLIYPNWLLIMPDDATGAERVTAVDEVPIETPAPPPGQAPPLEVPAPDVPVEEGATDRGEVEASGEEGQDASGLAVIEDFFEQDGALVGTGLLAAGLVAAIEAMRRRRRTPEPSDQDVEVEVALRIGADLDRAAWFDNALRMLSDACGRGNVALPAAYAARVSDDLVELLIAPAAPSAPAPWSTLDEGRLWVLERSASASMEASSSASAPFPGMVSLGRDAEERDVLVDLEAATGPICVVGDPAAAYEVVTAMAAELATNPWSDHLRVTGSGLPEELTALDEYRYREVPDISHALPDVESRLSTRIGGDVLTGRVRSGGSEVFVPEYIAIGTIPPESVAAELTRLTSGAERSPLGVVCAGDLPGARWRFTVDAAGNLDVPLLGLSVRANRLSRGAASSVATLMQPERDDPDPASQSPAGRLPEAWLPESRPFVPLPGSSADESALATAPVRVFVLGPPEVQCDGEIEDARREIATEIVVHLALHPEGVHPTVLAGTIWPKGVTAAVRDATIERVRDWLGTGPEGSPYLQMTADEGLKLSDDVVLDWDVVKLLLTRAREVNSPAEEADLLRRALRVARGQVLSERPRGRYAWIARARLERTASDLLVDAAHRFAVICFESGEFAMSVAAARAGLRVRPAEQLLWRDLFTAEYARVGHEGIAIVVDELTETLRGIGVTDLEPETMALLDELLPKAASM